MYHMQDMYRKVYIVCITLYNMVNNIRVDDEITDYLDAEKLIKEESYKSVLKRLISRLKLLGKRR